MKSRLGLTEETSGSTIPILSRRSFEVPRIARISSRRGKKPISWSGEIRFQISIFRVASNQLKIFSLITFGFGSAAE